MPFDPFQPEGGLVYIPELIAPNQQEWAQQWIDQSSDQWLNDLSRRVQHYGWRYDYKAKAITPDMYIGQLPPWLKNLAEHLYKEAYPLFEEVPSQCIVNEYVGSQGIAEHTDHKGFGPTIATISLISAWDMLIAPKYGAPNTPVNLPLGSCLIMTGPSRSIWTHQIPRTSRPKNERRISLTFRTVLNKDNKND